MHVFVCIYRCIIYRCIIYTNTHTHTGDAGNTTGEREETGKSRGGRQWMGEGVEGGGVVETKGREEDGEAGSMTGQGEWEEAQEESVETCVKEEFEEWLGACESEAEVVAFEKEQSLLLDKLLAMGFEVT